MDNASLKVTMVIPSYWSRDSSIGLKEGESVYDHPTPLDTDGTLARTIKSIDVLKDKDFRLVIIAAATSKDIEKKAEDRISYIIKSVSPDVETYVFGSSCLRQIHELFIHEGQKDFTTLLNLHGYSNIRNLCTFISHALGSDVAVLIDDDEVFEDQNFMSKVKDFIGRNVDDGFISGLTGYVINPDGGYKVNKSFHPWMKYWDKNERMNETFDKLIGTRPRLKKTSFALGGNMVIHRNLFSVVPFDPNVPRGEDTDFLINAMMFGFNFLLDNQLTIRHIPPKKSHPIWMRIR